MAETIEKTFVRKTNIRKNTGHNNNEECNAESHNNEVWSLSKQKVFRLGSKSLNRKIKQHVKTHKLTTSLPTAKI